MRNRKIIIIGILVISLLSIYNFISKSDTFTNKTVSYNGNKLLISIDGSNSDTLPTSGKYYLTKYKCGNKNTKVSWNNDTHELSVSNGNKDGGVACNLTFRSNLLLSEVEPGSYVAYTGNNGCTGASCNGQNANYVSDTDMGYCYSSYYKFTVNGWRVGYISNGTAYLVSAGAPECVATDADGNMDNTGSNTDTYLNGANLYKHLDNLDNESLLYCNLDYAYGGVCDSTSAWAMDAIDFEAITGSALSSSSCYGSYSNMSCGYTNSLIDNGGYYWYAARPASSDRAFLWDPNDRAVIYDFSYLSRGVRPVLRLQSSVYVTGGSGSYEDPYTIVNYSFSINDYDLYTKSNSVTLKFVGDNVATMCVSNTSDCGSYETFAASKSWALTSGDGEKTVYVYYKDGDGKIVASMSKSITVDSVAPTNNSISVSSVSANSATLSVSSSGANYMCFSSTNDSSGCSWVDYATSYKYKFDKTNGSKIIYGFFKDYAGNMSSTSVSYSCTTCENAFEVNYPFDGSKTIAQMNAEGLITIAGTSSDSAYDWVIDSTNKYFKSGNYNVNSSTGSSTITFTPTMDCSLSFDYGVDSESNFDKLTITLNDGSTDTTLVNAISGSKTGSITNQALTGDTTYVLKLKYVKDSSNHKNHDIGYIKNFVIE